MSERADELLPLTSDGRWIGRAVGRAGEWIERFGIWLQNQGAEFQWRRVSAWRGWGK